VAFGLYELDVLWRAHALAAEVDGFAYHGGRAAFEQDRKRDADLQAAGLRVMRITWRQLVDEPEAVAARLGAALLSGG
jgi:very-short-patch-repair endonuclease